MFQFIQDKGANYPKNNKTNKIKFLLVFHAEDKTKLKSTKIRK